jgi:hypothetical protein
MCLRTFSLLSLSLPWPCRDDAVKSLEFHHATAETTPRCCARFTSRWAARMIRHRRATDHRRPARRTLP